MKKTEEMTAQIEAVGAASEQSLKSNDEVIIASEFLGNNDKMRNIDMKGLKAISMAELYETAYRPRIPVVDGLLNTGIYFFAGAPKVGKSFFMAQLAYHVAMGLPLWEYTARKGSVLYLALEDDYARLQQRFSKMFGVEGCENLYLATECKNLNDGLDEQMDAFVKAHEDARLIIIDTLQKIKDSDNEKYSYANDYDVVVKLKNFADKYGICVLVVHHTRKMDSADCFEMISGTTGLMGAADGAFIMQKKDRIKNDAIVNIVGRDQQDQQLSLEFDREQCIWNLTKAENEPWKDLPDPLMKAIGNFISEDNPKWVGSASELIEAIPKIQELVKSNTLVRKLNVGVSILYKEYGILYEQLLRTSDKKPFSLTKVIE